MASFRARTAKARVKSVNPLDKPGSFGFGDVRITLVRGSRRNHRIRHQPMSA
jgi:hypothetical protein